MTFKLVCLAENRIGFGKRDKDVPKKNRFSSWEISMRLFLPSLLCICIWQSIVYMAYAVNLLLERI